MRKKLLAVTIFAACCSLNMYADEETSEIVVENAQETEVQDENVPEVIDEEVVEDSDGVQKVATPLKVIGDLSKFKTKSSSASYQALSIELPEEGDGSQASIYNLSGKEVGKTVLSYPETEVEVASTTGVYILSIAKDGEILYNTKDVIK